MTVSAVFSSTKMNSDEISCLFLLLQLPPSLLDFLSIFVALVLLK